MPTPPGTPLQIHSTHPNPNPRAARNPSESTIILAPPLLLNPRLLKPLLVAPLDLLLEQLLPVIERSPVGIRALGLCGLDSLAQLCSLVVFLGVDVGWGAAD